MSYRAAIIQTVERVAKEHKVALPAVSEALPLLHSGLDSLCWAIVIARMEETAGFDPFDASEGALFPVTLGDFIRAYDARAFARAMPLDSSNASKHFAADFPRIVSASPRIGDFGTRKGPA